MKNGILAGFFAVCCVLTHVYVGGVALVILGGFIAFNIAVKWGKTRRAPTYELKIIGVLIAMMGASLAVLILVFPTVLSNLYSRISSYLSTLSSNMSRMMQGAQSVNYLLIFLTLPYCIGLFAVLRQLASGIKAKATSPSDPIVGRKTFLAWIYVTLAGLILFLIAIPSTWQQRFSLLSFVPIALITPVGLKEIERWLSQKHLSNSHQRAAIISLISLALVAGSLTNVLAFVPTMGPSITTQEYQELEQMRASCQSLIGSSDYIHVSDFKLAYWVEYVLDRQTISGTIDLTSASYDGHNIFEVVQNGSAQGLVQAFAQPQWNPFLALVDQNSPTVLSISTVGSGAVVSPTQGPQPPGKQPPGQQPSTSQIRGEILFKGQYYVLSLVKYTNGTIA